jgi:lactate dehydrogenase-like 2-hydroxyacid dehydrogenase
MLPRIAADTPLAPAVELLLAGKVELSPWSVTQDAKRDDVVGLYTYGHPLVDGPLLDRLPALRVISNYGVGVDHIRVGLAAERGIPVGNTPGILDGATADMAFCLLLAAAVMLAARNSRTTTRAIFSAAKSTARRSGSLAWAESASRSPSGLTALT